MFLYPSTHTTVPVLVRTHVHVQCNTCTCSFHAVSEIFVLENCYRCIYAILVYTCTCTCIYCVPVIHVCVYSQDKLVNLFLYCTCMYTFIFNTHLCKHTHTHTYTHILYPHAHTHSLTHTVIYEWTQLSLLL